MFRQKFKQKKNQWIEIDEGVGGKWVGLKWLYNQKKRESIKIPTKWCDYVCIMFLNFYALCKIKFCVLNFENFRNSALYLET